MARLITASESSALQVPTTAVFPDPRGGAGHPMAVFVLDHGHARLRPVQVRARNPRNAWIAEGLREGEVVIDYPGSTLADGARAQARAPR